MFRRRSLLTEISSLAQSGSSAQSTSSGGGRGVSPLDDVVAPRPLTAAEADQLRAELKATLKLTNCSCVFQAEEDAVDLLTYAFDLIGDGETVGAVLGELEFMELEICGPASLEEMRVVLANFLGKLDPGNQENAIQSMPDPKEVDADVGSRPSLQTFFKRNSLQSRMRRSENHVAVDLSCKTAKAKKEEEMRYLFGGLRRTIKDRMSMYDDQGKLKGPSNDRKGAVDLAGVEDGDGLDCDMTDQALIDQQRRQELMMVMHDKSLTKTERSKKMGEVRAKFGLLETKAKIALAKTSSNGHAKNNALSKNNCVSSRAEKELRPGNRRSSINLSAAAAAAKNQQELDATRKVSLKDRMSMYDSNGNLVAKKEEVKIEEVKIAPKEKSADHLRREELILIMKDKSLTREEKARKMDQVKQKYGLMAATGSKSNADQAPGCPEQKTQLDSRRRLSQEDLDDQERIDLQIILRNRSLSSMERKEKMEQMREVYAALSRKAQDPGSDSSRSPSLSSTANVNLNLSAKRSALRKRESLELLTKSGKIMSLKERKSMYANDEFIRMVK